MFPRFAPRFVRNFSPLPHGYRPPMNQPNINRSRLLERFLQYVRVGTTANPNTDRYPSSEGQLTLGKILKDQLSALGLKDVRQDENGLVWGTVPSTAGQGAPTILLNAHLDTSPEAPGDNVNPQVVEAYAGGDITLGTSGKVITAAQCPALDGLVGKSLITTDGTTLLGGDDKAGVAIIMELAAHLMEHPELPHGPVQVLFTCDEEIGRGTHRIRSEDVSHAIVGYTLDGGGAGTVDQETFSADMATVKFFGSNIHPSIAKGRMVNALRAASLFVSMLPMDHLSPESTEDRKGFVHPYDMKGGVGEAQVQLNLRDFETAKLAEYATSLQQLADTIAWRIPGIRAEVIIQRQYRNMADGLRKQPLALGLAEEAFKKLNVPYQLDIIRGGTDGAFLTELGLPTPNLASGQHNIHSVLEFACLDQMESATEHLIVMLDLWQGRSK